MIIEVNTDVILATINKTDNLIKDFSGQYSSLKNSVSSVGSSWKGTDYNYFSGKIDTFISNLNSLINYLENYNVFLKGYVEAHVSLNEGYISKKINLK